MGLTAVGAALATVQDVVIAKQDTQKVTQMDYEKSSFQSRSYHATPEAGKRFDFMSRPEWFKEVVNELMDTGMTFVEAYDYVSAGSITIPGKSTDGTR